jgi:DNA-binding transcriptional MerR regulator
MFSAREVSRLAGFEKPWMLNHLEREEIFVPETEREKHHGRRRSYTFRDLVVLRAINRLLKLGARPKRISEALSQFAKVCPDIIGDASMNGILVKFAEKSGHFVVTPNHVTYCRSRDELIELIDGGQMAFSFMIDNSLSTLPVIHAAMEVTNLSWHQRRDGRVLDGIAKRYAID